MLMRMRADRRFWLHVAVLWPVMLLTSACGRPASVPGQQASASRPDTSAVVAEERDLPPLGPVTLWTPTEGELYIDLDTSRTASVPDELVGEEDGLRSWIVEQGLDVALQVGNGLVCFDAVLCAGEEGQWRGATARSVTSVLSGVSSDDARQGVQTIVALEEGRIPADPTVVRVRTREGGEGILRVRPVNKHVSRLGIEVEYRMIARLDEQSLAELTPAQLAERIAQLRRDEQVARAEVLDAQAAFDPQDPRIAKARSLLENVTYETRAVTAVREARIAGTQPASTRPAATERAESVGPVVNLRFEDFPSRFADGNCLQGLPPPVVLTGEERPAFCKSAQPVMFDMHRSPIPTRLLLDESEGTGAGYDTLYVDFDDDGDFLDDPAYRSRTYLERMFPGAEPVVLYFPSVHIPRNLAQGRSSHVQVFVESLPGWPKDITRLHPRIIPQRWAVGTVLVEGRAVPAAVIDRDWDGTFVTKAGLSGGRADVPRGDYLVLGLDGEEGLKPCDLDDYAGSARVVMNEYLAINDKVYRVEATKERDGVSLELVPADLPSGTLTLEEAPKVERLILYGTKVSAIIQRPGARISVPVDSYYAPQFGRGVVRQAVKAPASQAEGARE